MDSHKVVIREVQRNGSLEVFKLLAESIVTGSSGACASAWSNSGAPRRTWKSDFRGLDFCRAVGMSSDWNSYRLWASSYCLARVLNSARRIVESVVQHQSLGQCRIEEKSVEGRLKFIRAARELSGYKIPIFVERCFASTHAEQMAISKLQFRSRGGRRNASGLPDDVRSAAPQRHGRRHDRERCGKDRRDRPSR